jgi:predicted phosphoribosyltransferase
MGWKREADVVYEDREHAANLLADELAKWRGCHALVVAIPRGAVPMARIVADRLDAALDVVLVRKLGAPMHAELAVGAVDESGWVYVPDSIALRVSERYVKDVAERELATIRERRRLYTPHRPPIDVEDRVVIVVDDGLATGSTMIAALHALRARNPRHLVCAVPVASPEALAAVTPYADEIVCLSAPEHFHAVGQFYREFPQVSDAEVIALLRSDPLAARDGASARGTDAIEES